MLEFYKKMLWSLLCLLLISVLAVYLCMQRMFLHLPLLPSDKSGLAWTAEVNTDKYDGGQSSVTVNDASFGLDFDLHLSNQAEHPFASLALAFNDGKGEPQMVDLSAFNSLSFSVKCSPANVLALSVFTVDPEITDPANVLSFRSPSAFFTCDETWKEVTLDMTRLETPQWWLDMFKLKLSMTDYQLDRVPKLMFGSTHQSPRELNARVQINALRLNGQERRYLYLLIALLAGLWTAYGIWFFRLHARALVADLRLRMQKDRPLVAYQQLSLEPQRDREKDAILRFMATAYADPELNLDSMVSTLGISRAKINDALKAELGYTFTGYLNKLRLTEAARLLADKEDANIGEIAYSVGYKNISYFNKLFKEEYGCTPKTFKQHCDKPGSRP